MEKTAIFFEEIKKKWNLDFISLFNEYEKIKNETNKILEKSMSPDKEFTKERLRDLSKKFNGGNWANYKHTSKYKNLSEKNILKKFKKMTTYLEEIKQIYDEIKKPEISFEDVIEFIKKSKITEKEKKISILFLQEIFKG